MLPGVKKAGVGMLAYRVSSMDPMLCETSAPPAAACSRLTRETMSWGMVNDMVLRSILEAAE